MHGIRDVLDFLLADLADRYRCTRRTINRRIAAAGAATPARPTTVKCWVFQRDTTKGGKRQPADD